MKKENLTKSSAIPPTARVERKERNRMSEQLNAESGGGIGSSVLLAEQIATRSHANQFRRDGVTPYITHPEAIVKKLAA